MRNVSSVRSLLFALVIVGISVASFGQIGISVAIGPPALPVYSQPLCPQAGYLWTPGYWAYGENGYFWVPGAWVGPPAVNLLWTPPYWGWGGGGFLFHEGYWGPHVGFYGGISYGFGYFGVGFEGGRWNNGQFAYNRSVSNVNITNIHNVYNEPVTNTNSENRVSYNGGTGGIEARPSSQEEAAANEKHVPPVAAQVQHTQAASANPQMRASANNGKPPIAAVPRPGAIHPNEIPAEHPDAASTGDAEKDKQYQEEQSKVSAQQQQDRQELQQKQEHDHQQLAEQKADDATKQQTEQKHYEQTQQLQQKHAQQQQALHNKYHPAGKAESGHKR
jgi:hypothetical protein